MRKESGSVLLELLVAMLLLSVASAGVLHALSQAMAAHEMATEAEQRTSRASRLLGEHALLSGDDLAQRLGGRKYGGLLVSVTRPEQGLYRIAVSDTLNPAAEELVTVLGGVIP